MNRTSAATFSKRRSSARERHLEGFAVACANLVHEPRARMREL
jgi:hypothetical protein